MVFEAPAGMWGTEYRRKPSEEVFASELRRKCLYPATPKKAPPTAGRGSPKLRQHPLKGIPQLHLSRRAFCRFLKIHFIYTSSLSACTYVHHMCAWRPQIAEVGAGSLGTGITGSCELPCVYWEPNLGPLEEQQMLLIATSSFLSLAPVL